MLLDYRPLFAAEVSPGSTAGPKTDGRKRLGYVRSGTSRAVVPVEVDGRIVGVAAGSSAVVGLVASGTLAGSSVAVRLAVGGTTGLLGSGDATLRVGVETAGRVLAPDDGLDLVLLLAERLRR